MKQETNSAVEEAREWITGVGRIGEPVGRLLRVWRAVLVDS